jgi:hypothetical protein
VTVSLPYEPGRDAFASLARTAEDLSRLAQGRIEELPPSREARSPVLAHLERSLFAVSVGSPPELDGSLRFLEGAGIRGTLELVADEILGLIRDGTAPEEIAIVCPTLDRWRASLDTAFATLGVPYSLEGRGQPAGTRRGRSDEAARPAAASSGRPARGVGPARRGPGSRADDGERSPSPRRAADA